MTDRIAIVGAGFSGTLLAINLVRMGGPPAVLIERRGDQTARGVAYSSPHPDQLLNVRAGGMSAFPDDLDHFVRWLAARGAGDSATFVPRSLYGTYLAETLAAQREVAGGRLSVVEGDVRDLAHAGGVTRLTLDDGSTVEANIVVLATGNLPPHAPPGIDAERLPAARYLDDPWRADPAAGLGEGDTVVLLGTGLTAVDVALELDAAGFRGTTLALSRRGLRPRPHRDGLAPAKGETKLPDGPLSGLVALVRARAGAGEWRAAVDALRPVTQRLWAEADSVTRGRFLRHLRPYWDVHRHRLAPAVAAGIDAMVAAGRLSFAAGTLAGARAVPDGIELRWRPRGGDAERTLVAARVVNCTGPQGDLTRSTDPLLSALHARGAIRPDRLRLGIDVDEGSHIIAADGTPDPQLYCLGPMTRGRLWEVVAVPDIRVQAWTLAQQLAGGAAARGL